MSDFDRKDHWQGVYRERNEDEVSWFQPDPALSLGMIRESGIAKDAPILDAGGGASRLIDTLLAQGYSNLTVLDIAGEALRRSQRRLGPLQARVTWVEQDVTRFEPPQRYALWHDRAAFHFLTDAEDRLRYLRVLERALLPGAQVILAAFALDGPERCSGLPVQRYDAAGLAETLGPGYALVETASESHHTPAGKVQQFIYARFAKRD